MIEPILSLAISLHANPGAYAVLVGSGASRSAKIPTGWEVVLDLVQKLATLQKEDCGSDPAAWYHDKYGKDPDYSELLDAIGKSPAERQRLLREYFEPTNEEREQGFKQPTPAHRAIAKLVAGGYCRLILTTNFDKLIERAIDDEGISPVVLSTPDAIEGMLPLVHQRCCVVKLHGDYLDTRIKNTPAELASYDPRLNQLLDQVFDNFGLIVCGWSADWDPALRRAVERCKTRRFTTYWAARGEPSETARQLIQLRDAQVMSIVDADGLFAQLHEKVEALRGMHRRHPLSAKVAVAETKKYLVEERHRISLHDLLMGEVEQIASRTGPAFYPVAGTFQDSDVAERLTTFEKLSEVAAATVAVGCYWGNEFHWPLWTRAIARLANPSKPPQYNNAMQALRAYPALLLTYAGGLGAVANGNEAALLALFGQPKVKLDRAEDVAIAGLCDTLKEDMFQAFFAPDKKKTPRSLHIRDCLRNVFRELIPDDEVYDSMFDTYETLQSLWMADVVGCAIPGLFMCWYRGLQPNSCLGRLIEEAEAEDADWRLLKMGFFDGKMERWTEAVDRVRKMSQHVDYRSL